MPNKQDLRKARLRAIGYGFRAVVLLLFFVYGLIQKTEADRQRALAEEFKQRLELCRKETEQQKAEAHSGLLQSEENASGRVVLVNQKQSEL